MRRIMLAVAFAVASAAQMAHAHGTNLTIRSEGNPNFCFDAKGDQKTDGTPVFMYKCHGKENQRWAVTDGADGKSVMVGTGGMCLDVKGTHSKTDGTPVQLWKCHFGANQKFTVADGQIKEEASGKCLQAVNEKDGAAIVLDECTKNPKTEKWVFKN